MSYVSLGDLVENYISTKNYITADGIDGIDNVIKEVQAQGEAATSEIQNYVATKETEFDALYAEASTDINNAVDDVQSHATTTKDELTSYGDAKQAEFDALYKTYEDNLIAAASEEHVLKSVTDSEGVHGLRWNDTAQTLQYKNGSEWTDAAAKINLTQTINSSSTADEAPSAQAVYNFGRVYVGTTAPDTTENTLWTDSSSGVVKYYDGSSWVATTAAWG